MNIPSANITSIRFSCGDIWVDKEYVEGGVLDLYSRYRLRRVLIEGSGYRR